MITNIITLLSLSRKSDIETFLLQQCMSHGVVLSKNTPAIDYFHTEFIRANKDGSSIPKSTHYLELCIYYALAQYRITSLDDPHYVGEAAKIAEELIDVALKKVEKEFGPAYAIKNPHVVGNVLNVVRSAYLSLQEKS